MAQGIVLAHERANAVQIVEPHQCCELNFIAGVPAQQVDMTETLNVTSFNRGNNFAAYDSHISFGVLRRSPATPDSTYHLRFLEEDWPSISVEPISPY